MPAYHPFLSLAPSLKTNRDAEYCHTRDVHALLEVSAVLQEAGYSMGRTLVNHPPTPDEPPRTIKTVDTSRVPPDDVIMTSTRPPKHDARYDDRKPLRPAYTDLEDRVFRIWALVLDCIARSTVWLAEPVRDLVRPGFEGYRHLSFYIRLSANIKETNDHEGSGWTKVPRKPRSVGYVLRVDELWPGGPGYLGFFSMDSRYTLAWASLLRDRFPEFVTTPGFAMVEMTEGVTPHRPTDLEFHSDWKTEVVVHQPM